MLQGTGTSLEGGSLLQTRLSGMKYGMSNMRSGENITILSPNLPLSLPHYLSYGDCFGDFPLFRIRYAWASVRLQLGVIMLKRGGKVLTILSIYQKERKNGGKELGRQYTMA